MKTSIVSILRLRHLAFAAAALATMAGVVQAETAQPVQHLSYAASWGQDNATKEVAGFKTWVSKYTALTDPASQSSLLSQGVVLAQSRRAALERLIESDPEKAIASAVPASLRAQLPEEVASLLETRVSGIGNISVLVFDPARNGTGPSKTVRTVTVGGKKYEAFVYGRRAYQGTKEGVPLHGIAIGSKLALHEAPLRQAEEGETAPASRMAADLRASTEKSGSTLIEVGGKFYQAASLEKAVEMESRLEAAESGAGPVPLLPAESVLAGASPGVQGITTPNPVTPWTVGLKNIIIIRVDFSDDPGDPNDGFGTTYTADYVHNFTDAHIDPFYQRSSFGQTSITNVATAKVYRMPRTEVDYGTSFDNDGLHADAEAAASADYDLTQFDRILVLFNFNPFLGYGGLAQIGGKRVWINGEYDYRVVAHEIGHTYGLYHANLWQVSDGNPISPNGQSIEYGDDYDTMGANFADTEETDFNMWKKNLLGWLTDSQIIDVANAGTYRINHFDNRNSKGPLAIRVTKDTGGLGHYYWIGYRSAFVENSFMSGGAYIFWGYNQNKQSDLLDMNTPNSDDSDAGLKIGSTFKDTVSSVVITPMAQGTDTNGLYLDVKIGLATKPPTVLSQPVNTTVADGKTAAFTVSTSSGDTTYQWQREASGSSSWSALTETGAYTGTASPTLLVYPATVGMSGDQFRCVLGNEAGTINSSAARLTVISNDVETLSGRAGFSGTTDGTATTVRFNEPYGVTVDAAGNAYVADTYNFTIRQISQAGVVTTLAGQAGLPGSTNGILSESRFGFPKGIAAGSDGVIYIADTGNHTIRKITREGFVNGIAGLPGNIGSADGEGSRARFNYPQGLAVDASGTIYVSDTLNHTIRKITPSGTVTTFAGRAGKSGSSNGVGTNAAFAFPIGLVLDGTNSLFVADSGNNTVRRIDLTTGAVTTYAGTAGQSGSANGTTASALFNGLTGLAMDKTGNLYITDTLNDAIRQIAPDGTVTTVTGQIVSAGSIDGRFSEALFSSPAGIAVDSSGNLYVADRQNETVRLITTGSRPVITSTPSLSVAKVAGRIVISWPTSAKSYVLEKTASLVANTVWTQQTNGISTNGSNFVITNNPVGSGLFYRLHVPQ